MLAQIYIPHWLDSMDFTINTDAKTIQIYIPHWLDSMYGGRGVRPALFDLHSTLVRFYVPFAHLCAVDVCNLHSTLVRFYGLQDK